MYMLIDQIMNLFQTDYDIRITYLFHLEYVIN